MSGCPMAPMNVAPMTSPFMAGGMQQQQAAHPAVNGEVEKIKHEIDHLSHTVEDLVAVKKEESAK